MIDLKLLSRQEALFLLNLQTPEKDPDQSSLAYNLADLVD